MGHKITTTILTAFISLLCLNSPVFAYRIINDNHFTSDSDGAKTQQHFIGYQQNLNNSNHNSSIKAQLGQILVSTNNDSERLNALKLNTEHDISNSHLSLRLTPAWQSAWQPVLAGATLSLSPYNDWYTELFIDRELIDSVTGIRNKLLIDTAGASIDYKINPEFMAVGAYYNQLISDNNRRTGYLFRLIYTPETQTWFNIQSRSKLIDGKAQGTGYFSPLRLEEHWLITTLSTTIRNDAWAVKFQAGLGTQKVDQQENKSTLLAEIKLRGWQTDHFGLEARAGYTNNGSFSSATSVNTYHYRYIDLSLIGNW